MTKAMPRIGTRFFRNGDCTREPPGPTVTAV
jgi:hypothetical protein